MKSILLLPTIILFSLGCVQTEKNTPIENEKKNYPLYLESKPQGLVTENIDLTLKQLINDLIRDDLWINSVSDIELISIPLWKIKSLQGIQILSHLKTISLEFDTNQSSTIDLSPLGQLLNVEELILKNYQGQLLPAELLNKIVKLDMQCYRPIALPPDISQNGFLSLKEFSTTCEDLNGFSILAHSPSLNKINFNSPSVNPPFFRTLESLKDLKELKIYGGENKDFTQFPPMPQLRTMTISSYHLQSLKGVSQFSGLSKLEVIAYSLTDCVDLEYLTELESLRINISNNRFSNQEFNRFGYLIHLRDLEIIFAHITSLEFLEMVPHLETLNLFTREPVDLSSIASLKSLKKLKLQVLEKGDYSFLNALPQLKSLDLEGSNLSGVSKNIILPDHLEELKVAYSQLSPDMSEFWKPKLLKIKDISLPNGNKSLIKESISEASLFFHNLFLELSEILNNEVGFTKKDFKDSFRNLIYTSLSSLEVKDIKKIEIVSEDQSLIPEFNKVIQLTFLLLDPEWKLPSHLTKMELKTIESVVGEEPYVTAGYYNYDLNTITLDTRIIRQMNNRRFKLWVEAYEDYFNPQIGYEIPQKILHELGHVVDIEWSVNGAPFSQSGEWQNAFIHSDSVSKYGLVNYTENFAESFSAYFFDPLFKCYAKPMYEIFKNHISVNQVIYGGTSPFYSVSCESLNSQKLVQYRRKKMRKYYNQQPYITFKNISLPLVVDDIAYSLIGH